MTITPNAETRALLREMLEKGKRSESVFSLDLSDRQQRFLAELRIEARQNFPGKSPAWQEAWALYATLDHVSMRPAPAPQPVTSANAISDPPTAAPPVVDQRIPAPEQPMLEPDPRLNVLPEIVNLLRVIVLVLWLLALVCALGLVRMAHGQVQPRLILQYQNQGTVVGTVPAGVAVINCSTNMTCAFSGNVLTLTASGGGGGGGTFQVNGVNLSSSSTINFLNSAAHNGETVTFTNTSAGNIQLGLSGTPTNAVNFTGSLAGVVSGTMGSTTIANGNITNAMLANSSVTVSTTGPLTGGGALSLGGTLTLACGTCVTTSTALGGDLSGTVGAATVAAINGVALGSTAATSGNLLIGSGSQWVTQSLSGDATVNSSGVLTLATVNAGPGTCGDATHVCQIVDNGKGLITSQSALSITATGGSRITASGLNISWNPLDLSATFEDDHFFFGSMASGQIGKLGWLMAAIGASGCSSVTNGAATSAPPQYRHDGIIELKTASTGANLGCMLGLDSAGGSSSGVFANMSTWTNWEIRWVFQLGQTTSARYLVGLTKPGQSATNPPSDGVWVRFDTGAGDTTFTYEVCTGGSCLPSVSAVTPAAISAGFPFYMVSLKSTVVGTWSLSLATDTGSGFGAFSTPATFCAGGGCTVTKTLPATAMAPALQVIALSAAERDIYVDYWSRSVTGM